jgi:hypothetical protein
MSLPAIHRRARFGMVAAGYASVVAVSSLWIVQRYLAEQRNPADFSSGMAAGGDWFLELIIVGMLLAPTLLLAWFIRNSEPASATFAKVLLGLGISAPACAALMAIPAIGNTNLFPASLLGSICLYRVLAFPMTVIGLAGSAILVKCKRPRRIILYSLGIEIMTFIVMTVLLTLK